MHSATSPNKDRRIARREAAVLEVYLRDEPLRCRGTTLDISRCGVSVNTKWKNFTVGTLIDLVFVQREGRVINLLRYTAIVVRHYDGGVGLRFCAS
ncbi:MAG: PilZ domain-containing protein [Chromatiaceae bacterium]|nr:PilZ domain-containing protein [Gammaproteobacteria bacterium]MCP5446448.1 PilZ domain-containing protein [Chromatiaceae bacterium]MCB1863181.1 PilZ domain-containing protein [Gammaproteobacteria bacterium]MCB1872708.1 PilZ domain-containing protein [Gammaproteobacteria bacterium]MCB1879848.1 PilZ domain-containing protein [Gammaproteobacteria bacterium]